LLGTISTCEGVTHIADFISEGIFEWSSLMSFAHDGLRDSLTHLAAPPYFYENLRRELVTASRNRTRLTLIRFLLYSPSPKDELAEESESLYEVAILSFAEFLKGVTRADDLCARLGQFEFTLILKASQEVGDALSQRVLVGWKMDSFTCKSSLVSATPDESVLEILNRLDNQELRGFSLR